MKLFAVATCLLLLLYCVNAAPRPCRRRRDVNEKASNDKTGDIQKNDETESQSSRDKGQQNAERKQYVPYVPAYNMGDVICEDNQPVQVVQVRDLSITNGVIKKSNIVQL